MTISGTIQLAGRVRYAPPVPASDWSVNPSLLADVLEAMACSGREEGEYTLTADGDTSVSFGSLPAVHWIVIKVAPNVGIPPSPGFPNGVPAALGLVTIKLTGLAGVAQAVTVDGFMVLVSQTGPYTAMTIARAAGVQTTVRVLLFAAGS